MSRVGLFMVCFGVLSGCVRTPAPVMPIGSSATSEVITNLDAAIQRRVASLKSYRGLYRCVIRHVHGAVSVREAIVATRQAGLRLETLPDVGASYSLALYVLNSEKGRLIVGGKKFYRELSRGEVPLTEDLSVEISADDLREALLGGKVRTGKETIFSNDSMIQVVENNGRAEWFYTREHMLERLRFRDADQVLLFEGVFSNFDYLEGNKIPKSFTFQLPEEDISLECAAQYQSVNETVKPEVFSPVIPRDFVTHKEPPQ